MDISQIIDMKIHLFEGSYAHQKPAALRGLRFQALLTRHGGTEPSNAARSYF